MGLLSTNLVAVYQGTPRLIRPIPTGGEALVKSASQNLGVDSEQAAQFVYKFGLAESKLEGQVYKAIQNIVDSLIEEVDKSIKFFHTRYQGIKISKIIVTGDLAILPEFPLYLVNHSQIPVEIGNSWINVNFNSAKTNQLASISHQFAVAVGLAVRQE
jgi:type IV pilus assembly protein PilM